MTVSSKIIESVYLSCYYLSLAPMVSDSKKGMQGLERENKIGGLQVNFTPPWTVNKRGGEIKAEGQYPPSQIPQPVQKQDPKTEVYPSYNK